MSDGRVRVVVIRVLSVVLLAMAGLPGFLRVGWGADDSGVLPMLPVPYDGAANVNPDGLVLRWWPASDAKLYDVYLGTAPDSLAVVGSAVPPEWAVTTPLTRGECYYWHVAARVGNEPPVDGPMRRFTVSPPSSTDISLLAWYAFDEGAGGTSRNLAGGGGAAQLEQMTWGGPAAPDLDGASIRSDGFGSGRFPIPVTVLSSDRLTLTGWFRVDRQNKPAAVWSLGSGRGSCVSLVQPANGGAPFIEVQSPGQGQPLTSQMQDPFPVNQWTHLAVLLDGPAREMVVYEDGAVIWTAEGLTGLPSVLEGARDMLLGASFEPGVLLRGGMDEIRLYTRLLTAQEIAQTMLGHPDSPYEPSPRQWAQVHASVPATLRWQGSSAGAQYNLYTGVAPDRLDLAASGLTGTEYSLQQPPADGQTFYWRVEAVLANGLVPGPLWRFSVTDRSLGDLIAGTTLWWADFTKYYRQIVPDVSLTDVKGGGHRLRDYRGRHLLVVVWAPWCSKSRAEMTELSSLRSATSEDDLAILTITDESNRNILFGFLAGRADITFPVCLTTTSSLPAPLSSVAHVPSIFYIAPDGLIKLGTVGPIPRATIEAILAAAWPRP